MSESATESNPARPSGRHPVSVGHLVMGLAFLGLVGVWALVQGDVVDGDEIRWLLPVPWVLAGIAGLAATAVSGARRHSVRQVGWVGDPASPSEETSPDSHTPSTHSTLDPEENR